MVKLLDILIDLERRGKNKQIVRIFCSRLNNSSVLKDEKGLSKIIDLSCNSIYRVFGKQQGSAKILELLKSQCFSNIEVNNTDILFSTSLQTILAEFNRDETQLDLNLVKEAQQHALKVDVWHTSSGISSIAGQDYFARAFDSKSTPDLSGIKWAQRQEQTSASPIFLVAGDYSYISLFLKNYVTSLAQFVDSPQIHVHLVAQSQSDVVYLLKSSEYLKCNMTYTYYNDEGATHPLYKKALYRAIRYFLISFCLEEYQSGVVSTDIDVRFNDEISGFLSGLDDVYSLGFCNIKRNAYLPWTSIWSGVSYFRCDENAKDIARVIAVRLEELFSNNVEENKWLAEQVVLFEVSNFIKKFRPEIKIIDLCDNPFLKNASGPIARKLEFLGIEAN